MAGLSLEGDSMEPWGDDIITTFFLPNILSGPGPLGTTEKLAREPHKGSESGFQVGSARRQRGGGRSSVPSGGGRGALHWGEHSAEVFQHGGEPALVSPPTSPSMSPVLTGPRGSHFRWSVTEDVGSSALETEALTQQTAWEGPGRGETLFLRLLYFFGLWLFDNSSKNSL